MLVVRDRSLICDPERPCRPVTWQSRLATRYLAGAEHDARDPGDGHDDEDDRFTVIKLLHHRDRVREGDDL